MEKEKIIAKYNELKKDGFDCINLIYAMDCLTASDGMFQKEILTGNDELRYDLACIIDNVWLKSDTVQSISLLADWLMLTIKNKGLNWVKNTGTYELIDYFCEHFEEN